MGVRKGNEVAETVVEEEEEQDGEEGEGDRSEEEDEEEKSGEVTDPHEDCAYDSINNKYSLENSGGIEDWDSDKNMEEVNGVII